MKISFVSHVVFITALAAAGLAHAQVSEEPKSPSVTPALGPAPAPPTAPGAPSTYVWAGTWFSNHYAGGYGGAVTALNADRSLWDDGPLLRADVSGGDYTYNNPPAFSDKRIGVVDADLLAGYRANTDTGSLSGYVGLSYINHHNHDPAAPIRGSKVGATVLAEYAYTANKNLEFTLQGRYSTPFSTYSAATRLLYKVTDAIWIGPQVTLYGNDAPYKEITAGPFMKINTSFGEVGLTGGYRHPIHSGTADGYFASLYFAVPLRP